MPDLGGDDGLEQQQLGIQVHSMTCLVGWAVMTYL